MFHSAKKKKHCHGKIASPHENCHRENTEILTLHENRQRKCRILQIFTRIAENTIVQEKIYRIVQPFTRIAIDEMQENATLLENHHRGNAGKCNSSDESP